jgi:hypothetical protein
MHDSLSTSYQDDYNYTFRLNLAANQLLLYSRGLGQRERERERQTESSQLHVPLQISSVQGAVLSVDADIQWTPTGIQTDPYITMKYWYGSNTL